MTTNYGNRAASRKARSRSAEGSSGLMPIVIACLVLAVFLAGYMGYRSFSGPAQAQTPAGVRAAAPTDDVDQSLSSRPAAPVTRTVQPLDGTNAQSRR